MQEKTETFFSTPVGESQALSPKVPRVVFGIEIDAFNHFPNQASHVANKDDVENSTSLASQTVEKRKRFKQQPAIIIILIVIIITPNPRRLWEAARKNRCGGQLRS